MLTSYHVHSKFSDGENYVRDIIQAAVTAGLDEVGISDHYVLMENGVTANWSMPLNSLPKYFADISASAEEVKGKVTVRFGLEADFDPSAIKELGDVLRAYPFDYVLGSVHFVDMFPIDEGREHWDRLNKSERNDMVRAYWVRITQMANSGLFDIASHLDLYKKFGHIPTTDLTSEISTALDAIAKAGMSAELNTSGWFKEDMQEAYPSLYIIQECHARNIPMLITADAHNPANLTRGFDRAADLLRSVGYTEHAIYAGRNIKMVPLE